MPDITEVVRTEEGRGALRQELLGLLGVSPPREERVSGTLLSVEDRHRYVVETLLLELNEREPVPAYFVKPSDMAEKHRFPVILYNHAHGGDMVLGKDELLDGRSALRTPPYADALANAGYSVLCIDAWGFGERRGRSLDSLFKEMLWEGKVLWGAMVHDSLRAVDYLLQRDDVDGARLGTMGLSMGSTMAWWIAALCADVKVCVDLCCLTDFHALIRSGDIDLHGTYYFVPGLLSHFTTSTINALIAPRAHLALAGIYDRLTPPEGLDRIDGDLRLVYSSLGAEDHWRLSRYQCGHVETSGMRAEVLAFLGRWL